MSRLETFDIRKYMKEYNKEKKNGKCIGCSKVVQWCRSRLMMHKRANCTAVTDEEKSFFAKRSRDEETSSADNSMVDVDKEDIDSAVANFFFRTGIAFKAMLAALNPEYAKVAPSAKTLGGRLLDKKYNEAEAKLQDSLGEAENLTLTSDGWTNLRGDHIVNFVITAPGQKPFFLKSIETTGIHQTAREIADTICGVIEEVGPSRIVAVVTDNMNTMAAAWTMIEERHPHIAAYGCAAHILNLLVKDILKNPAHIRTMDTGRQIVQFINNHHIAHAKFQEKMKETPGVTHKLTVPVKTRWYTEHTSAIYLRQAKTLLKRMAHEDWEVLEEIDPKPNSSRAITNIKNTLFWDNLDNLIEEIQLPCIIIGK